MILATSRIEVAVQSLALGLPAIGPTILGKKGRNGSLDEKTFPEYQSILSAMTSNFEISKPIAVFLPLEHLTIFSLGSTPPPR